MPNNRLRSKQPEPFLDRGQRPIVFTNIKKNETMPSSFNRCTNTRSNIMPLNSNQVQRANIFIIIQLLLIYSKDEDWKKWATEYLGGMPNTQRLDAGIQMALNACLADSKGLTANSAAMLAVSRAAREVHDLTRVESNDLALLLDSHIQEAFAMLRSMASASLPKYY